MLRSRKNANYSFEYKLHMVELYLSSEVSYQELALSLKINNPALLNKWVNDYRIAGPDALRSKKKGRKKSLGLSDKEKNIPSSSKSTPVDTSAEHVKQLEDELLNLRIENAYLKELRRLRLEDEARLSERQESSTASEEISNRKTFSHTLDFQKLHICIGRSDLIEKIQILNSKVLLWKFIRITKTLVTVEFMAN